MSKFNLSSVTVTKRHDEYRFTAPRANGSRYYKDTPVELIISHIERLNEELSEYVALLDVVTGMLDTAEESVHEARVPQVAKPAPDIGQTLVSVAQNISHMKVAKAEWRDSLMKTVRNRPKDNKSEQESELEV